MLIPASRLLARLRSRSPRDEELSRLRARLSAQGSAFWASPEARALASRIRELKRALSEAFAGTRSCRGCARGEVSSTFGAPGPQAALRPEPPPKGRWDGGRCCGTGTFVVFTPGEVHALKVGGTRAKDLAPPQGDLAGCAFRGPTGCSLAAEDRPAVCLVYACGELKQEIRDAGAEDRIHALRAELHATFEAFLRATGAPPDRMPAPTSLVER